MTNKQEACNQRGGPASPVVLDGPRHAACIEKAVRAARPSTSIESPIHRSWSRCIHEFGIRPQTRRDTQIVTRSCLRERQQALGALLPVANRELENLYELIAGTGYVVALADVDGTVLNAIADPRLKGAFRNAGLWLGAVWDERHEGTNGIGTCLAECAPVTVHHGEHFKDYNINLTCSGAPITDAAGRVIGALDASSVNDNIGARQLHRHTMALVSMSASLISRYQFFAENPDAWVLRFHSRAEFVGLLQEALLAIDGEGRVQAANESAVLQLGVAREQLVGQSIEMVFAFEATTLQDRATHDAATIWPIRDVARGRRFFALIRPPLKNTNKRPPGRRHGVAAKAAGNTDAHVVADPDMRRNFATGHQLFAKQVPILLHGETGTGKDVFAHALHDDSAWADGPFVVVNCAAIPEALIESELFGYRPGAFTGASREGRSGRILQSSGGTLFLDEIGDMPLLLQARLLRAIETREITPVGGDRGIPVDLHVISASHRDLQQLTTSGEFREDLYYRLTGITLELPPLRDRKDKEELIQAILRDECTEQPPRVTDEAMRELLAYRWPGNIRQLRNALRTAAALCRGDTIHASNLPQEVVAQGAARAGLPAKAALADAANPLQAAERAAVLLALEQESGNVSRAAMILGVSRNTLYRKLHKYDIQHRQSA